MILRQLFEKESATYSYLLADEQSREALIIDCVFETTERDFKLVTELGLSLKFAAETHTHADHISGARQLRAKSNCKIAVSANSQALGADCYLKDGDTLQLGALEVKVIATPGHTDDSVCFYCVDSLFTGDTLFIRGCGRTDFQNGNPEDLFHSVTRRLFVLPDTTRIYPGHDYNGHTSSSVGEEKLFNPRLTLPQNEFVVLMRGLNLPRPKRIDEALPANLRCGL